MVLTMEKELGGALSKYITVTMKNVGLRQRQVRSVGQTEEWTISTGTFFYKMDMWIAERTLRKYCGTL